MPVTRNITGFFEPHTQAKNKRTSDEIYDNIIVGGSQSGTANKRRAWPSPHRRKRSVTSAEPEESPLSPTPAQSSTSLSSAPQDETKSLPPTSSLSSLPPLSQSTASSGSKRVVKDGVQIVRTSDSEDEDSDSSLEELSVMIARRKPVSDEVTAATPPAVTPLETVQDESRRSTRGRNGLAGSVTKTQRLPTLELPEPKYKFSLSNLVLLSNEAAAAEARVAAAKAELDSTIDGARDGSGAVENVNSEETLDSELMAAAAEVGEDESRTRRLLQAMDRTDTLQQEPLWHFFKEHREEPLRSPFPKEALPLHGWLRLLRDPTKRRYAFTSGFVCKMSAHHAIPDEVMAWMLDELTCQPLDELTYTYLKILESSGHQVSRLLAAKDPRSVPPEPSRFEGLFLRLGARESAVRSSGQLSPTWHPPIGAKRPLPPGLGEFMDLVRRLAPFFSCEDVQHAVIVLLRLSVDNAVLQEGSIQIAIHDALVALIESIPDEFADETLHRIGQAIVTDWSTPTFRQHLITALPNSSPRLHLFRRRLALAFFLSSPTYLTADLSAPSLSARILQHLATDSLFRISHRTDHIALLSSVTILDVAIDCGFSSFDFTNKQEERLFNDDVEVLVAQTRAIEERIIDNGASHMRRTVAKEAARRLAYRLEYAVRTREKVKRDIFANDVVKAEESAFMKRWFSSKGEVNGVANGVVDQKTG